MKYKVNKPVGTLLRSVTTVKGSRLMSIDEFHYHVRNGFWKPTVEIIRQLCSEGGDEKKIAEQKEDLPLFVAAGDCRKRRTLEGFTSPTGYVPVDIDHIPLEKVEEIRALCPQYHWVKAFHSSVRQEGCHLFVAMGVVEVPFTEQEAYKAEFKRRYAIVCAEVSRIFGVQVDGQCKDVLRGMFASYDPQAYCRPEHEVEAFEFDALQSEPPAAAPTVQKKKKKNVAPTDEKASDQQGVIILNQQIVSRFYAKNAYVPGKRHGWWRDFGSYLKFRGEPWEAVYHYRDLMIGYLRKKKVMNSDDPVLRSTNEVDMALKWGFEHNEDDSSGEKPAKEQKLTKVQMAEAFLQGKPLRYDLISRKVQMLVGDAPADGGAIWKELGQRELSTLWKECVEYWGKDISLQTFHNVLKSDVLPAVNPLIEYVQSVPEWDEQQPDYIAQAAGMVHLATDEEQQLFVTCFRKWFVAMVSSWLDEETVNHQVLVLIGEQGIYKTTWLDALMPPELVLYRSKQSSAERLDKDEQLRATEFGLINLDEIDRMPDRELNALKSLITTVDVNVRTAYAYDKERRIRIASYVASGNKDRFLSDTTGNRRWLPFHVTAIDSPFSHQLPYRGMYAQARYLIARHFNYWFSADEVQQLEQHVDSFRIESNEEQLIPVYFEPARPGSEGAKFLTLAEIAAKLKYYGNLPTTIDTLKLGKLMKMNGFTQIRSGRKRIRGYILRELTTNEIEANQKLLLLETQNED